MLSNEIALKSSICPPVTPLEYDYFFKFHLIGDRGVGKYTLLKRYIYGEQPDNQGRELYFDYKVRMLQLGEKVIKTQVWYKQPDPFRTSNNSTYSRGAHAVIVVFDLTDLVSFQNVKKHINEDLMFTGENPIIILVGTKCDLNSKRVVNANEIKEFRKSYPNIAAYFEANSTTGQNVDEVFATAAKLCVERITKVTINDEIGLDRIPKDTKRESLKTRLKHYIDRIESHPHLNKFLEIIKTENDTDLNNSRESRFNFSFGFWVFKNSRALNREANYYLAKDLLKKLNDPSQSIESIFNNIDQNREDIMQEKKLYLCTDFKNRGINSTELNTIINMAQQDRKAESQSLRVK